MDIQELQLKNKINKALERYQKECERKITENTIKKDVKKSLNYKRVFKRAIKEYNQKYEKDTYNHLHHLIHYSFGSQVILSEPYPTVILEHQQLTFKEVYIITTPLLNEVNDGIMVYLYNKNNQWYLDDDGSTDFELSTMGLGDNKKVLKKLRKYANNLHLNGIHFNKDKNNPILETGLGTKKPMHNLIEVLPVFVQDIIQILTIGQYIMAKQRYK